MLYKIFNKVFISIVVRWIKDVMGSVGIDIIYFKVYFICLVVFFLVLRSGVLLMDIFKIGDWFFFKNFKKFYCRDICNVIVSNNNIKIFMNVVL